MKIQPNPKPKLFTVYRKYFFLLLSVYIGSFVEFRLWFNSCDLTTSKPRFNQLLNPPANAEIRLIIGDHRTIYTSASWKQVMEGKPFCTLNGWASKIAARVDMDYAVVKRRWRKSVSYFKGETRTFSSIEWTIRPFKYGYKNNGEYTDLYRLTEQK